MKSDSLLVEDSWLTPFEQLSAKALDMAEELCEMHGVEKMIAAGDCEDYIEVRLWKLLQRIKETD